MMVILVIALWQATTEPLAGNPEPKYPVAAKRLLVAGDVTFRASVSPTGSVEDVIVLRVPAPNLGFEDSVRDAVLAWRFAAQRETTYFLGTHSFRLRPEDEEEIRDLARSAPEPRFHHSAAVFLADRVYRKTEGSWLTARELLSLRSSVRGIDFSAGNAAEVTLHSGGVMRVLEVHGAWQIVSWESRAGEIEIPEKIVDVLPVFPRDARTARREDVVVLQALIDHTGLVRFVDVVTSVPELDGAAMTAARQWQFRPARRDGVAIPFVMTLTVGFRGEIP